jgi:hypothetical protein
MHTGNQAEAIGNFSGMTPEAYIPAIKPTMF